jgi:thymidine kinase
MISPPHPLGKPGWVEVIAGGMFSGKTEELIRRLRRAHIARQSVSSFKPALDDRYDEAAIVSHDQVKVPSTMVRTAGEILEGAVDAQVVGIDEAQFFERDIVDVTARLAKGGKRVIVAGLDLDYRGNPFGPMPELLVNAEYVTKALAICVRCGGPATRSQRLVPGPDQILVGASESYEARCRHCFDPPD